MRLNITYFNEAGNAAIVDNGINTNWIDETFQNAFAQRHDLFWGFRKNKLLFVWNF
jgi:hypothetical protein